MRPAVLRREGKRRGFRRRQVTSQRYPTVPTATATTGNKGSGEQHKNETEPGTHALPLSRQSVTDVG